MLKIKNPPLTFSSSIMLMIKSLILFTTSLFLLNNEYSIFLEWEISSINSSSMMMVMYLDWKASMFMSTVLAISSLILIYSQEYMKHESNIQRFISIILMFVLSMMFLIISPNMMSILIGWDGLGLVSYCLVIYYQSKKSFNAGMMTALSNRIGDVMILMTIICMFSAGSWNFLFYLGNSPLIKLNLLFTTMILIAAMTKSAQLPFSAWLPAAMAAPTPVSSLVHSSTLVTAGVYLLIRFNKELMNSNLKNLLLITGTLTMFLAGMTANFETDLKKIIALSTLSQLGLMMSILSMGYPNLALFHLMTHALFKALLFMCAGHIIHTYNNNQDIRLMGSIYKMMPMTTSYFMLANMSLCGMPFLAGFYSKDLILEMVIMNNMNLIPFTLYFLSTGLTMTYTTRLIKTVLCDKFKGNPLTPKYNMDFYMVMPMMIMSLIALMGGSLMAWMILVTPPSTPMPTALKILTPISISVGMIMGNMIIKISNSKMTSIKNKTMKKMWFSSNMWFMPMLSTMLTVVTPLKIGKMYTTLMDQGWMEKFGPQGLYSMIIKTSKNNEDWMLSSLKSMLMMISLSTLVMLIMMLL
nr:NADH dehydrogenase subunit 5 [Diplatys flavicollis]